MDIMGERRFMGYQLDDARTRNGRTILVPCLQVAYQKAHVETGIYGIECGPFRNAVYEWTRVDSRNP